jgi:hypothetical protein
MDVSITRGDLLLAAATMTSPIVATLLLLHRQNVKRLDEFFTIMKQFPVHRHSGRRILYPKGWSPGEREDFENGQ